MTPEESNTFYKGCYVCDRKHKRYVVACSQVETTEYKRYNLCFECVRELGQRRKEARAQAETDFFKTARGTN